MTTLVRIYESAALINFFYSPPLSIAHFFYLIFDVIDKLELLFHGMMSPRRELPDPFLQELPPRDPNDFADFVDFNRIFGQGAMDPVLDHRPHPGRFSLITQLSRRNPDRAKSPVPKQKSQPLGVELVRLVDLAHHGLGLPRIRQQRDMV